MSTALTTAGALVALSEWIDRGNADRNPEAAMWGRVSKIGEEFGEVIEAVIGVTGQNPRKGRTHTWADVEAELLDVAVTALGAIEHIREHDGQALALLGEKIRSVHLRAALASPALAPQSAELPQCNLPICPEGDGDHRITTGRCIVAPAPQGEDRTPLIVDPPRPRNYKPYA